MQTLAAVTYLLFLAYVANAAMLAAVAARQAGGSLWRCGSSEPLERLTVWAMRAAFAVAMLWPPLRLWTGGLPSDPLAASIEGLALSLCGHLLVAVGAAIALIAQYHLGVAGADGNLVQTGPYALSRNPVLLGRIILFLGLFLAFPDIVLLLAAVTVVVAAAMHARSEERVLARTFGDAYADYRARAPRWISRSSRHST
jgi:protein-S-isoprenylcysteine O-methyltransferase Ste14